MTAMQRDERAYAAETRRIRAAYRRAIGPAARRLRRGDCTTHEYELAIRDHVVARDMAHLNAYRTMKEVLP